MPDFCVHPALQIPGAHGSGGVLPDHRPDTRPPGHRLSQSGEAHAVPLRTDHGRGHPAADGGQLCRRDAVRAGAGQLPADHRLHAGVLDLLPQPAVHRHVRLSINIEECDQSTEGACDFTGFQGSTYRGSYKMKALLKL